MLAQVVKRRMKRASYREGVEVIAMNDEPTEMEVSNVIGTPTCMLLAVLFDVSQDRVAEDVVKYRTKRGLR